MDMTHQSDVATQEELIKSEEERLTVSQALLTMQLDLNKAQVCAYLEQSGLSKPTVSCDTHLTCCHLCAPRQLDLMH